MDALETKKDFKMLIGSKMPKSLAIISDTHNGSKLASPFKTRITYKIISDLGIQDVFHLGDFFDFGNFPRDKNYNHLLERYMCEQAIERATLYYPQIPTIKTYVVRGGHDIMPGENLSQVCMIDELCKYRRDLINITSNNQIDPSYFNFHSDVYYWDNIDFLFRHSESEDMGLTSTKDNIGITLIGHYHEYIFSDSTNYRNIRLQPSDYKIYVPSLSKNNHTEDVDFIIMEISEDEIVIKPISLVDNEPVLDKVRTIRRK